MTTALAWVGLLAPGESRAQLQVTVHPASMAFQNKAPLAWIEVDPTTGQQVPLVMNMEKSLDNSSGDWYLQPRVSTTFGRPVGNKPGWSTTLPNGVPLTKIQAFGGEGHPPRDGTTDVDWSDGSFLRISATAATRYGLPPGSLFYSTRLNTTNTSGYGYDYRIVVYLSTNQGASWTVLPPPALGGAAAVPADPPTTPPSYQPAAMVGLYSNFLFERSDGTIQIYYDNQPTPWAAGHRYEQWLTMKELTGRGPLTWGAEIIVDGNQPGRSATSPPESGMASVSERGIYPASVMLMTHEDDLRYTYINPATGSSERRYKVIIVILKSTDGGRTWSRVGTIQSPGGYHYLAPWHIRSKLTNQLVLTFRSDLLRQTDAPRYDPFRAAQEVVIQKRSGASIRANLFVMTSADDGISWQSFYPSPDQLYMPGGPHLGNEPGVAEILLSPTRSHLLFQWGSFDSSPGLALQVLDCQR